MRIAIIVRSLKIGGMERVAISLAEAFASNSHESHLIYFKNKKNTLTPEKDVYLHHFNLDRFMHLTIFGFFYDLFFRIFNIFLRKSYPYFKGLFTSQIFKHKFHKLEKEFGKFDLIIVRGQGTLELIFQNSDPRIVLVSENIFSYGTMNKLIKNIQIKSLYHNRNIVGVSNGVVQNFQQLSKDINTQPKKLIKITNPINPKQIETLSNKYIPNVKEPFILSVGRIVPAKNIPLLVSAYSHVKHHYNIPHKLVIIGIGSDLPSVQRKIEELSLEENVILVGQISNPFPWMKHADLFILSSKFEGLGMVLLEALACQTKVVATKSTGGVTDIMKDELAPYLAEQTPESLGEKIASTLLDTSKSIDYKKHLLAFKPVTIINQYINAFVVTDTPS